MPKKVADEVVIGVSSTPPRATKACVSSLSSILPPQSTLKIVLFDDLEERFMLIGPFTTDGYLSITLLRRHCAAAAALEHGRPALATCMLRSTGNVPGDAPISGAVLAVPFPVISSSRLRAVLLLSCCRSDITPAHVEFLKELAASLAESQKAESAFLGLCTTTQQLFSPTFLDCVDLVDTANTSLESNPCVTSL